MDLPSLRKRPTYGVLLNALQALEVQPNSWSKSITVELSSTEQATVQRFLMSIIASDLEWLQDSTGLGGEILTALEQKELLFDLASRRVAERCGRSGKPPKDCTPWYGLAVLGNEKNVREHAKTLYLLSSTWNTTS